MRKIGKFLKRGFSKLTLLLVLAATFIYAAEAQDFWADAANKYADNEILTATKLNSTFGKLFEGAWTKSDTTDDIYFNKGNVGVGTDNPKGNIHLKNGLILFQNDLLGANQNRLDFRPTQTSFKFAWRNDDGSERDEILNFNKNGEIYLVGLKHGIGTKSPQEMLDVSGNIAVSGTVNQSSDARYKENVSQLTNALDKVMQLSGISFDWKEKAERGEGTQIGFIAQEVEKVLPELVVTGKNGYKSVAYANITAVLVEAIKELKTKSDATISTLQTQNMALQAKLSQLEQNNAKLMQKFETYETKINAMNAALNKFSQMVDNR